MKIRLPFLILSVIALRLSAQDLPHHLTPYEKTIMPEYLQSIQSKGITQPPISPLRTPAEWEEVEGLTITWTTSNRPILAQIVKHAQQQALVYINCTDSTAVKNYLLGAGITPSANLRFITTTFNSIWIRDYGAQSVYKNDVDSLILVDWIYNRPRPLDDVIPEKLADYTGLPLYQTTVAPYALVNTGGNFMSDGFGTAFASNLVLDENPGLTTLQVDSILLNFMGIKRIIKMTNLPHDGIHHIDMHMKLLNEETLLIGQYPAGVSDGPQIEANLNYVLSNFNSVFGTPYKVVRIPMPPDSTYNNAYPSNGGYYLTYTNSVFVNKTLLVPTYYQQYDTTALRILRENLPGYNVIGIPCYSIIPASGAIHCITNSVTSRDPLLISHQKTDTLDALQGVTIKARIQHRSGISSATVKFRFDTLSAWQSETMILKDSINHLWEAAIPVPVALSSGLNPMYYFIEAVSNSNKTQVRPITAPVGYFTSLLDNQTGLNKTNIHPSTALLPPYPNPARAITCVPVETEGKIQGSIELFTLQGQKIKTLHTGELYGKQNFFFNAAELPAGAYLIRLISNETRQSRLILVR